MGHAQIDTPYYTFPGTNRTIDVRTVTDIANRTCGLRPSVVGFASGNFFEVVVDDPVAVADEVAARQKLCWQLADHGRESPADREVTARLMGEEIGKTIAAALGNRLIEAVLAGFRRIATDVADEVRRRPV